MKPRILLLGKNGANLDLLEKHLSNFNQTVIKVNSENKTTELLNQNREDLIIIDTSFTLHERKKLLVKINTMNKKSAFHLLGRQEGNAVHDMLSFVKDNLKQFNQVSVGK
jgi:two-component SAPR family response regulator